MTQVVCTFEVTEEELAVLLRPRDDLVAETQISEGCFELAEGPFDHYSRTVTYTPNGDGHFTAVQTADYHLAIPIWGVLFAPVVKREVRRPPRAGIEEHKPPWWSPPDRMDARTSRIVSLSCVLAYMAGWMGTLMTQTNTFFKDEFGATDSEISFVLTGVRIGAFLALFVSATADRRGRKVILIGSAIAAAAMTVVGGLAPGLVVLGLSQMLARCFSQSLDVLVRVYTAEEVPPSSRAFTVSVLTMCGALGAGNSILVLSLADLSPQAWRILFLVPALFIWPAIRIGRTLPESKRFVLHEQHEEIGDDFEHTASPELQAVEKRVHYKRFAILGVSALLFGIFFTPQANYMNEYLRDERGFTSGGLVLFAILTNLPGGIGIVVGGRLADTIGRRKVGAVAVVVGVAATLWVFFGSGATMWAASTIASLVGAAAIPALFVYGPELFPTAQRGLANGGLNLLGVTGAVIGLLTVGALADPWGGFGPPLALLAIAPAIVVVLVLTVYPETAHRSLEELNPEDDLPPLPPVSSV